MHRPPPPPPTPHAGGTRARLSAYTAADWPIADDDPRWTTLADLVDAFGREFMRRVLSTGDYSRARCAWALSTGIRVKNNHAVPDWRALHAAGALTPLETTTQTRRAALHELAQDVTDDLPADRAIRTR